METMFQLSFFFFSFNKNSINQKSNMNTWQELKLLKREVKIAIAIIVFLFFVGGCIERCDDVKIYNTEQDGGN